MSDIKPALTSEEWARGFDDEGSPVFILPEHNGESEIDITIRAGDRKRFAAACLHEQLFGFTREDVENHRGRSAHLHVTGIDCEDKLRMADWHDSMADRIEALLPPEEHDGQ